jgi:hypothetical protein
MPDSTVAACSVAVMVPDGSLVCAVSPDFYTRTPPPWTKVAVVGALRG